MRRFELAGTPLRYWEITIDETIVRLRWGAVERAAQTYEQAFSTERDAAAYAERQIAAQVARGYIERVREVAAAPVSPRIVVERHQRFEWPVPRGDTRAVPRFLEVTQEGNRVTVRGGRIVGGKLEIDRDKLATTAYATAAQASAVFDERCADARYDGGAPVHAEAPTYVMHENAELEAQCLEHPDRRDAWAVYADWLIAHGDARGEIAALALAGKHADAKRLVASQLRDLCGTEDGTFELELRHGFAVRATITVDVDGDPLEDVTRAFLASPMARFIEGLRFGLAASGGDNDWGPTLHAVATSPRAAYIRELRFDHYDYEQSEISWTPFGDFSGAWDRLPALELLHIKSGAGGTLGTLDLPNLRTLIRESGGLARTEIAAIVGARWPRLEHLEIWFGSSNYGAEGELSDLRPILDAVGLPALRHLGIVNCEFVDAAIPELARSRILPQLSSLDLSKGVMGRLATRYLVEHAASFRHLASIDLDANMLLDDEVAQIRGVLDNVIPGKQRERDYEDDDDEEMERYVAVGE